MDRRRGEVAGPVQEAESLQCLAALEGAEQPLVEGTELAGIDLIEAFPQVGVAGGTLNAIAGLEVRPPGLRGAILVELEQRGVLKPEQRQPRHQMVRQGDATAWRIGIWAKHRRASLNRPWMLSCLREKGVAIRSYLIALSMRRIILTYL